MKILALLCVGVLFIAGCNAPPPEQVRKTGATLLYDVLIEVDPATAKKDAQFMSTAMSTDIIPFVTNSQLPAAQLIPQLRKLLGARITGQKYVGAALSIVSMATSFGNININAPKMSDTERAYVLAACNAIQDACDGFLTGKAVRVKLFEPVEERGNASMDNRRNHSFVQDGGCGSMWRTSVRRLPGCGSSQRENPAVNVVGCDGESDDVPTGNSGRCFVAPKQDWNPAKSKSRLLDGVSMDSKQVAVQH